MTSSHGITSEISIQVINLCCPKPHYKSKMFIHMFITTIFQGFRTICNGLRGVINHKWDSCFGTTFELPKYLESLLSSRAFCGIDFLLTFDAGANESRIYFSWLMYFFSDHIYYLINFNKQIQIYFAEFDMKETTWRLTFTLTRNAYSCTVLMNCFVITDGS